MSLQYRSSLLWCYINVLPFVNPLFPPECDNLTRLDLVKHSVQAVIAMMKDGDRLGLVAYDDQNLYIFILFET